ncbi:hypothetical protein Taro_045493 [Colocasia esculenta]|uniref:Uncharacterized protein n=1 Tax=Colocasia esculenta TaxID=4460 RepID=A0A843X4B0_COLES|nr:hypothetical protein [Colocasia esculenta]
MILLSSGREQRNATTTNRGSSSNQTCTENPEPQNTTSNMETRRSANNRLTAGQSIITQTRPSWHRCQDTATKVSPSVTERREVTSRVPYQKVLRAKPALGHMPTHKLGHGTTRGNTGNVVPPQAVTISSRRGRAPRHQLIATGRHVVTGNPVTTGKRSATALSRPPTTSQ